MFRKQTVNDLAIFGGPRIFQRVRMTGQLSAPNVDDYICVVREFCTDGRDFVTELEAALADRHGVRHCITVTNACLGLLMLLTRRRR